MGKRSLIQRTMPRVFGAWLDKNLSECMFIGGQKHGFTVEKFQACPWYLELPKKLASAEMQVEKDIHTGATLVAEEDSEEEEQVAVTAVVPTTTKKDGKNTKTTKTSTAAGTWETAGTKKALATKEDK